MPSRGVTVTTAREAVAFYNPKRTAIMFHNRGTLSVFVSEEEGGAQADDWEVQAGVVVSFLRTDLDQPEVAWFMEASSGSQDVRIWESFGEARTPGPEVANA